MNYSFVYLVLLSILPLCAQNDVYKTYTVQEFLDAPESELRAYKKKLDALIEQKKLNLPPSQAMLFYPNPVDNQELLLNQFQEWNAIPTPKPTLFQRFFFSNKGTQIDRNVDRVLNSAMKAEENAHRRGGVILYNSTNPEVYAKNLIDTSAKKLDLETKGKKTNSEMLLLRDPTKHQSYEQERAKRKHFLKEGAFYEHSEGEYLLSCNVGLTGNTIDPSRRVIGTDNAILGPGESTLKYFLKKLNVNTPKNLVIAPTADDSLLDEQLKLARPELEAAAKKFSEQSHTGILLQLILKDEKLAKKVLYNSLPGGRRRNENAFRESLLHGKKVTDPLTILRAIRTEPHAFAIPQKKVDIGRERDFKGYFGIDLKRDFQECLDSQQLRTVLTGKGLLNMDDPEVAKNFAVHAYSADDKNLKEFQGTVHTVMNQVKHNYLAKKDQLTFFDRLKYRTVNFLRRRPTMFEQKERIRERKYLANQPF
jgi:hypothetical protein